MSYPDGYQGKIQICRVSRTVFQYNLLWPDDDAELNPGIKFKFQVLTFFLFTGVLTVLTTIHFSLGIISKTFL